MPWDHPVSPTRCQCNCPLSLVLFVNKCGQIFAVTERGSFNWYRRWYCIFRPVTRPCSKKQEHLLELEHSWVYMNQITTSKKVSQSRIWGPTQGTTQLKHNYGFFPPHFVAVMEIIITGNECVWYANKWMSEWILSLIQKKICNMISMSSFILI